MLSQKKMFVFLESSEVCQDKNPCVNLLGKGPDGKRCKDCERLYYKTMSRRYYHCSMRTAGYHRVRWNACVKFKERDKP